MDTKPLPPKRNPRAETQKLKRKSRDLERRNQRLQREAQRLEHAVTLSSSVKKS
jgi:hypothetical protein